ncbi:hypothetical protein [Streptomyces murinus]|uniref:hypothetical protein n=1 Tax=Streptomyces murinus TaxID=33900 RepID=UPI0037FDDCCE
MTKQQYALDAALTFAVDSYGPGLDMLRGPCPRCRALIEIPLFHELVKAGGHPGVTLSDPAGEPVLCTCEEDHEGRPAGRTGCGAYWNLVV